MSFVTTISDILHKTLGPYYAEKVIMAANVLFHEWHMISPVYGSYATEEMAAIKDEELRAFDALDDESKWQINKFVHTIRDYYVANSNPRLFFFNYSRIFENDAQRHRSKEMRKEVMRARKEYKAPAADIVLGDYESLVAHHGLADSPLFIRNYIRNGVFLDVGACYGDSTLVFLRHYAPQKVIAFEPSPQNREIYKRVMTLNKADTSKIIISQIALDKERKTIRFKDSGEPGNTLQETSDADIVVDCLPLDMFCAENDISGIRFIKADVEGMGLNVLLGAKEIIRKERPVLSLSIYHNKEELFGIYQTLVSWQLDYSMRVSMMVFPMRVGELSIFAWPREIEEQVLSK